MRNQFQLQTSGRGESKSGLRWSFPVKTFGFPFCLRLWDLTKRRDDIVVADMVADMAADMEVHTVADIEVDKVTVKVADMVANMAADKIRMTDTELNMVADMELDDQTFSTRTLSVMRVF